VIPANHKWVARTLVSGITTHAIQDLKLAAPVVTGAQREPLAGAGERLLNGR
jgi:hypothetical protein